MPTISKKFSHTCETQTLVNTYIQNYLKNNYAIGQVYQEASKFFFEDLKDVLGQTSIPVTFSEEYTYNNNTLCPYFEMFNLQFPVFVHVDHTIYRNDPVSYPPAYYAVTPYITRTGSANPIVGGRYINTINYGHDQNIVGHNHQSSLSPNYNERLIIEYTINVVYNDNWIIVSYTSLTGLKYPIFSLIKGKDINNYEVVYLSANPNACYANRGQSGTSAATYHQLIWTDDWYNNKYNINFRVPSTDALCTYSSYPNYNGNMFLKLSGNETIANIAVPDNKIQLMEPICCGNRVFFDNMYVVPDTVNTDSYYTINNELYYCPGDYLVQMDIQYNAATMTTHACRFLLKMESQN